MSNDAYIFERTGSKVFQFASGSTAMSILFDSKELEQDFLFQELEQDFHIGIQCFIQDFSLTSDIKSLSPAEIPEIRPSDNYQQRYIKFSKTIERYPLFWLKLYIGSDRQSWISKGEIVLQNRKSPYYPSLLTPYFTTAGEVLPVGRAIDGSYLRIGARIEDAGSGVLKNNDVVGILISYTLKYSLVPKRQEKQPSLSLPFSVQIPVLRDSEEPILVRPANPKRVELWLESHSTNFSIWFAPGEKNNLKPGEKGLALYGQGASHWFQSSSYGSQQPIWALALPPVADDLETNSVLLTGIEVIK